MREITFRVFRGENGKGDFKEYKVPVDEGMVVLDAVFLIQERYAPDLAVRWNCKAGKCGSCSAEINGKPRLMCKTKISKLNSNEVKVSPMKTFRHIKDLVTDVSWNYKINKKIPPLKVRGNERWIMFQEDVDRVQEFHKCIECFLCQNTCHVLRAHKIFDKYVGPRFLLRFAQLEMHPLDIEDRIPLLKDIVGYCNITRCCTEVCPEEIKITDNAIIPLKERVADRYFDPIKMLMKKIF